MKEIRLSKLTLSQFQGGNDTLQPEGQDVFCYGANASGKTRLVSAFTWALFSKDALNRAEFQIKNLNTHGEVAERGIDHSVETTLLVDGEEITLKKIFREKWIKARGRAQAEFSGHSTQHFINSIPKTEKEYKAFIDEMTGAEETFRLLTSPTTFPALPWQRQRLILLDVCGNISDADVIASDEKLSPLKALLEKFKSSKTPFEDLRTTINSRRAQINKELPQISIRIDEVRRGLPDITGIDRGEAERDAQRLEVALNDAKLRLQGVNTGGNIADLTKKLSGLNADLRKMEDAHRSGSLATLNRLNQQISEVEAKINASRRRITAIDGELKPKDRNIKNADLTLAELRERWTTIDAEIFKGTITDTCPTCNRPLPTEQVQISREKALSAFNENKAERLGDINRKGHELKEYRDQWEAEATILKKEQENISTSLPEAEAKLNALTSERDILKRSSEDFSALLHWSETFGEIEAYEDEIKAEREGKAQDIEKIKGEIKTLGQEHFGIRMIVDRFRTREQGENRMEELKREEKKLSTEYERLEGELYLIEQFIKTKVSMLTDRINGKFEMVRFKLFNQLISGGIEDCCEITVNGVPFNGGLNSSARTQAGCDIIRTLQQHFEMKAPVFCDNRESVTDLPEMDCQLISLVVSPEDKTLRIERR